MELGSIEREVFVDAAPEIVFDVVSSPEHVKEWWPDDADLESSSEAGPDELSEDADAPGSAPGEGERDEDASDDAADDDASRDGASDDDALSRSPYALPDSDPEPGSGGATDGVDEDRGTGADGDGEDDGRP